MENLRGIRRTRSRLLARVWTTISVLSFLGSGEYLDYSLSMAVAQTDCGETTTTATTTTAPVIRVEDATGVVMLLAALDCAAAGAATGGGKVEADWVGRVSVDDPIVVPEGTFLYVTGEDDQAEVHGGGGSLGGDDTVTVGGGGGSQTNNNNNNNGTRLFEVSDRKSVV